MIYIVFEYVKNNHKFVGCSMDENKALDMYQENPRTRYIVTEMPDWGEQAVKGGR